MPPKAKRKAADAGETAVWVYKADLRRKSETEGWAPFDEEAQQLLEESFLAGKASSKLTIKGKEYRVDYKKMLQVRVDDGSLQRPVARQVKEAEKPKAKAGRAKPSAAKAEPKAKRSKQDSQRQQFADVGEEVAPQAGGRVHFSGALMHDEFVANTCSMPYEEDSMSEYVGVGRYPLNEKAFPLAIRASFDSVAVDAGTRVIIYSEPDFKGKVLWDRVGPAIVVNTRWANKSMWEFCKGQPYKKLLQSAWKEPLQTIFPPEVREFSCSDMHLWTSGSLVITDGEAIPERLNEVDEYSKLDNPRC